MLFRSKLQRALAALSESVGSVKLYHGLPRSKLVSVLHYGLNPMESLHAEDEEMNDDEGFGPPYHFVYLSNSLATAKSFAPGGENYTSAEPSELLEITLPADLQAQLVTDRGEFISAPFVIPPQHIRAMSAAEY